MLLEVGTRLGPYEILALVGAGGMGEVYKARDTRLNRMVAVKRLTGRHTARFEQEAHAIAALNHPHICQIHDVGTTPDGFSYLVLEYIDGKPLRGPLAAAEAVRLAVQIASALAEAHAKGILHRDLKPANILLTASGSIKLLDFGLARLIGDSTPEATKTLEGLVVGTAAYMSPEQAQGQPVDERSDIFSFGAVLYEMFSGQRAFPGEHALTSIAAVIHKDPAALQAAPDIARIVVRCLRKSPDERFQSAAELRLALESARLGGAAAEQPSIGVLPFANMSGEKEQEYFSDGLAEEIINALVKIPGLRVIARTSAFAFKGQNIDVRRIAEALGVAHILEGSVRRSGNRIRVTAQLITAADGSHLWSERYDRELADVFEVQDEIAAAVAKALRAKLAPEASRPTRYTPKLAAHEALLKARHYHWRVTPESMAVAEGFYQLAIELDPQYAFAHAAYADYLMGRTVVGLSNHHEIMPLTRSEVQKALDLDSSLPDAHAILGILSATELNWKQADHYCSRALADDALSPWMRAVCANFFLLAVGRNEEALEQEQRALLGDPLHPGIRVSNASCLMAAGRLEEAEHHLRYILDINPSFIFGNAMLAGVYWMRGLYREALTCAEKAANVFPPFKGMLAGLLYRTGQKERADELLSALASSSAPSTAYGMAYYYLFTEDLDRSALWFEKAIEELQPGVVSYLRSPIARPLRESAHWPRLLTAMKLPEA